MNRYVVTPLIVVLSPVHSDITTFRSWSPIATGNHLDHVEKITNFAQTTGSDEFLICVQAFRDTFRGELRLVHIFVNDGP